MSLTVSVIIPNYNGRQLLEKHLSFVLRAKEYKANKIKEVIIIDDKSTDDSVNYLQKNFKDQIKLIRHTKNRGFSATVNTGARAAKGELLCLLNTDVSPTEKFLEKVTAHFKDKKVFGVGLHEIGFGYGIIKFKNGFFELSSGKETNAVNETFWISGGSGVFNRETWMSLGGLDEKLLSPFYWEDVDICYRARKRGLILLWEPKATVTHEHEATMSKLSQKHVNTIRQRNELLVIWKNLTSQRLLGRHIQGLLQRVIRHPGYIRIVLIALTKISLVSKLRSREKKESTVSDEAVFAKFN